MEVKIYPADYESVAVHVIGPDGRIREYKAIDGVLVKGKFVSFFPDGGTFCPDTEEDSGDHPYGFEEDGSPRCPDHGMPGHEKRRCYRVKQAPGHD